MKTILLPTDFSPASYKALDFAIQMAQMSSARIIVMNTFFIQDISYEVPLGTSAHFFDEIEMDSESNMEKWCEEIRRHKDCHGKNLVSEQVYEYDTTTHAIATLSKVKNADLVVMGTMAEEHIFGMLESTTLRVVHQIDCPVLVVKKDTPLRPFKKVIFALQDLNPDILVTRELITMLRQSEPFITILHFAKDEHDSGKYQMDQDAAAMLLKSVKDSNNYSRIKLKNMELQESGTQLSYLAEEDPDLMVILKQERSWVKEIFHKSFTKSLLKFSNTPVLIMHKN